MSKIFVCLLVVALSSVAFCSDTVTFSSNYFSFDQMCQEAVAVLEKIKEKSDDLENYTLECETRVYTTSRIEHTTRATFSDSRYLSCDSDSYKIVKTEVSAMNYSEKGMPEKVNPVLLRLLDRLELEYNYSLKSFDYEGQAPIEMTIYVPVCN